MTEIGEAGRQSNGSAFSNSNFGNAIVNDPLDFPEPENVHESDFTLPFVFICYDDFPMRTNLVKPYSALHLEKLITNYRISRARRSIENSFGILTGTFCIFRCPFLAMMETVESVTKCYVALYN